ncbi:MAG: hypothetical protein ABJM58_12725 [Alteripontixanthobacter sp.]
MGEYEPDDSRDVTLGKGSTPIEPERTGPREDAARAKAQKDRKKDGDDAGEAQVGYGNSRSPHGDSSDEMAKD